MFDPGKVETFFDEHITSDEEMSYVLRMVSQKTGVLNLICEEDYSGNSILYRDVLFPEHTRCFLHFTQFDSDQEAANNSTQRTIQVLESSGSDLVVEEKDLHSWYLHVLNQTVLTKEACDSGDISAEKLNNDILLIIATAELFRWDLFALVSKLDGNKLKEHVKDIKQFMWKYVLTGKVFSALHIAKILDIKVAEARRKKRFTYREIGALLDIDETKVRNLISNASISNHDAAIVYERLHDLAEKNIKEYPVKIQDMKSDEEYKEAVNFVRLFEIIAKIYRDKATPKKIVASYA